MIIVVHLSSPSLPPTSSLPLSLLHPFNPYFALESEILEMLFKAEEEVIVDTSSDDSDGVLALFGDLATEICLIICMIRQISVQMY